MLVMAKKKKKVVKSKVVKKKALKKKFKRTKAIAPKPQGKYLIPDKDLSAKQRQIRKDKEERSMVPVVDTSWVEEFLGYVETGFGVQRSCRLACIAQMTFYKHKRLNEEFRKRYEEARELTIDVLEDSMLQRATHGLDDPIFHEGAICGVKKKFNETLGIFMLKRNRKKYEDPTVGSGLDPEEQAQRAIAALQEMEGTVPDEPTEN